MNTKIIKDLMVPLEEYATVSQDATMYEVIHALEDAQEKMDANRYKYLHRGVLVYDENNKIIGKCGQLDILRGLEPKYKGMGDPAVLARAGFSIDFLHSMMDQYSLFSSTIEAVCDKAKSMKVRDFMVTPSEYDYVEESASLNVAVHFMVMGHLQSLLVTRAEKIVGILRLTDVFMEIFQKMENCCFVNDI